LLGGADQGRSFGFIRTVYMFLGASGSVVTGSLADSLGWSIAYGVVIALLAGSVLALLARRSFGWLRPVPQ
jgi:uncharacterized membrane protein YeaQ/YmgE (transglycosylase-associated protein family)